MGIFDFFKKKQKEVIKKETTENAIKLELFPSGKIKSEIKLNKDGEPEGLIKHYYENGQIEEEANYKNGKREGLSKSYFENGQLKEETTEEDNNPWTKTREGTNQSMQDLVATHFENHPLMPSYFIWLKEDEKDNKLNKDGLSVNLENKFALMDLCYAIISPRSENEDIDKKQEDYFMHLINIYKTEEFKKKHSVFNDKRDKSTRKDKAGNQYIERIIKNLSDYNKYGNFFKPFLIF
jgi:hypothetical protein